MTESNETVSVIIPVYNSAAFITETLASVIAQKDTEKIRNLEIIIVDDGSTDGTVKLIRDYVNLYNKNSKKIVLEEAQQSGNSNYVNSIPILIRIVPNAMRKGAAGARNTGIDEASGRYIAFIDSDDKWIKGKLSKQLEMMNKKDTAFSFTGYEFADEKCIGMGKIANVPERINYKQALKNTTIFTSTVMLDMEKLSKDDIYFPYIESEDTANWWKLLKKTGTAAGLDEPLTLYRRSSSTLSSNKIVGIRRIWNLYMNEGLSIPYASLCFICFAFNAVMRRL